MKLVKSILCLACLLQIPSFQVDVLTDVPSGTATSCGMSAQGCDVTLQDEGRLGSSNVLNLDLGDGITYDSVPGDSVDILSESLVDDTLSLKISTSDTFGSIDVAVHGGCGTSLGEQGQLSSDSVTTKKIYLYTKDSSVYASSVSMDTAIASSGDDPSVVNDPISIVKSDADLYGDISVWKLPTYYGKIAWQDNEGNVYPLVGAEVRFRLGSGTKDNIVYTDDEGVFDTNVRTDSFTHITALAICAQSSLVSVVCGADPYMVTIENDAIDSILVNHDLMIISSETKSNYASDAGSAFQIYQALYYYSEYARKNCGSTITACEAHYPYNDNDKSDTMYYRFNSKTGLGRIYIPSNCPYEISSYESWDTIGHEYGHHVSNFFYCCVNNGSGYSHYADMDDIQALYSTGKFTGEEAVREGLALAWSESWPTYWMEIAQHSFPEEIRNKYCHGYVGDEIYEAHNFMPEYYYFISHGEGFTDELELRIYVHRR
jgi:hypothetical protein